MAPVVAEGGAALFAAFDAPWFSSGGDIVIQRLSAATGAVEWTSRLRAAAPNATVVALALEDASATLLVAVDYFAGDAAAAEPGSADGSGAAFLAADVFALSAASGAPLGAQAKCSLSAASGAPARVRGLLVERDGGGGGGALASLLLLGVEPPPPVPGRSPCLLYTSPSPRD